jgi:8-oxo-dGTP diphosphatase
MVDQPLRCAGALIMNGDGRLFVQRRSSTRSLFPNAWDIVGGHLEAGESVIDALRREITEETGWRLTHIVAELPPVTYLGDDGDERVEDDFLVRVEGDLDQPRLEAGKHTEFRWIGAHEVTDLLGDGPGDDLARRILTVAFHTVRELGLTG